MPSISFTKSSAVIAISVPLSSFPYKLSWQARRSRAPARISPSAPRPESARPRGCGPGRSTPHQASHRRLHEEEELRDELLAARQLGDRLDLGGGDGLPVDERGLEHQVRVVLANLVSTLASATASPWLNATAVGAGEVLARRPRAPSPSSPARARVFLTTRYVDPSRAPGAQLGRPRGTSSREAEQERVRATGPGLCARRLDRFRFFGAIHRLTSLCLRRPRSTPCRSRRPAPSSTRRRPSGRTCPSPPAASP